MRMRYLLAGVAAISLSSGALAQAPGPDTLVIAQGTDASTLDPANISSRDTANIGQHLWGTLYKVTYEGKVAPYLAESSTMSEDGTEVRVKLRSGLTCQDGEKLTAEDVAYTFNRAADPANKFRGNTPGFVFPSVGFKEAKATGDLDVTITLGKYSPVALGMLAEVFIHCKDSYEKMTPDQAAQRPVGSGPYKFVSWTRDDKIVLERNESFALEKPAVKTLVWRVVPEASTRTAELIAGNVDIATNVPPDQMKRVNDGGKAKVQSVSGTRRIYIGFNLKPKFSETPGGKAITDVRVRRALNMAVDVPAICSSLLAFDCKRAQTLVNPPNVDPALPAYAYDPKKAEALLDEAGYKRGADGVRFSITLQTPNGRYLNDVNVAQAVGQFLDDIGVKTKVEPLNWATVYTPAINQHDAGPLFLLGAGGVTWSPLYDMTLISTPTANTNYSEWKNPQWFAGFEKISATRDPAEQKKVVDEMLKTFAEDAPWLMLYFQPDFYGVSNRIAWQARRDERIYLDEAKIR